MSEYDGRLPGEIVCTRLTTGSTTDVSTGSERRQLGLQLVGRPVTGNDDSAASSSGNELASCGGIFVAGVLNGSIAAEDANIHVGDQLLQV